LINCLWADVPFQAVDDWRAVEPTMTGSIMAVADTCPRGLVVLLVPAWIEIN
jgi:hypothetical protein